MSMSESVKTAPPSNRVVGAKQAAQLEREAFGFDLIQLENARLISFAREMRAIGELT